MDPIKILIQQLMDAANSGEDKRVMLALAEELRNALNGPQVSSAVPESVSVVMPNGFVAASQPVAEIKPSIKPQFSVPRPPTVVVVEVEPVALQPSIVMAPPAPEPAEEQVVQQTEATPGLLDFGLIEASEAVKEEDNDVLVEIAPIAAIEEPAPLISVREATAAPVMNMELMLTPEMIAEAVAMEMQALNPVEEPEWSQPQAGGHPDEGPRELNEKMAQRNKMLNEVFVQKEPELVEVLAKPRIADLRKSISINEKYQFIGSLFRGDEDMFERSIKTLNNFTVLQEAQYWMQRELIIKLGWNDEDELVQRFFDLVSRRFN